MKRTAQPPRKQPISWDRFEDAALAGHCADYLSDRVGERSLDSEDDHAAVEQILHRMLHGDE